MRRLLFSTLLMISMTPLAPGQGAAQKSANTSARKAIETANKRFVEVFNKGDAVAVAGMYTSDAKVLPPNSQTIESKENIQSFWQEFITMGVKVVKLETVQVEARSDTAYELGRYTLTIPQAGGHIGLSIIVGSEESPRSTDPFCTSSLPDSLVQESYLIV